MGDYLDKFSDFVEQTHYEDLSPEAIASVKNVTLDTIGVMLVGSKLPENAAFAKMAAARSGPANATIVGHPFKAEPMLAASVNGTSGVSLEIDEGNHMGGGHPSTHCLPGALAIAEEIGASGQQFMESVIVGYEIQSRLGGATVLRNNVHPHGLWGTIGTAVAVGKLRGYKSRQIRELINLAASMSPANTWTPCFEGGTIRNVYPGRSGLQGILATHLYECGYTGIKDGPSDILNYIVADSFDSELSVKGLGKDYRIQHNYFKFHACCRLNHPAVDAALELRNKETFNIEQIKAIDVATLWHPEPMEEQSPGNMLGAKFSIPYSVATALVRGNANLESFYPAALKDTRINDLASKVHVNVDSTMAWLKYDNPTAKISVQLEDGRVISEVTNIPSGDPANPTPRRQQLLDKFASITEDLLDKELSKQTIGAVDRLDQLTDVRELTSLVGG